MNTPPKDIFLNATAMSRLFSCDRLYQVSCLWGYSEHGSAADWGSKFHKYAEEKSLTAGYSVMDFFKNHGAVDQQFLTVATSFDAQNPLQDNTPLQINNKPAVEVSFSFELASSPGYNIILCGTIDRLDYEDGYVRILDYKTARATKIDEVLSAYAMQLQMPFYLYTLKNHLIQQLSSEDQDLIQSGKFFGKFMGVFISFSPPRFILSEMIALSPDLEESINQIIPLAISRIIPIAELGADLALPTGMATYIDGKCACDKCWMRNLCVTRNNEQIKGILALKQTTPYDPRTWR